MNSKKDIETVISGIFEREDSAFMTLSRLLEKMSANERKKLGLTTKSDQQEVREKLEPLPSGFQLKRKGRSQYLIMGTYSENLLERALLSEILRKPGRTIGQIGVLFPYEKNRLVRDLVKIVNRLIDENKLKIKVTATERAALYPAGEVKKTESVQKEKKAPLPAPPPKNREAMIRAFKKAFDETGAGKNFVFIYRIRRRLDWSRQAFDNLMKTLREEGYIAAHPGNPGELDSDEVADSYQDRFGELYITISWRKPL